MNFPLLQIKLHNGQLKKSSLNIFLSNTFFKRGKHDCKRSWNNNSTRLRSIDLRLVTSNHIPSSSCFVSLRNFFNYVNSVVYNECFTENDNSQKENGVKDTAHTHKMEKIIDEEKTKEKSNKLFKNEEEGVASDSAVTQNIYDTCSTYTDFIIDKCKDNIKNDEDTFENTWYVKVIYELLNCTKIMLDCSWVTSIITTTAFMRIIILPLTISAERDRRKQQILNPLIKELTNKLKTNAQNGNIKKALEFKKRILNIRNTHGISLIPKSIILMAFFQTPLFFIFYFSMKKIASHPDVFKEFTLESPLWLDSLSLPDPYYILPFLSSLLLLSNNELTALIDKNLSSNISNSTYISGAGEETDFQKNIRKISKIGIRLFYISSAFFFKSMPSGLFIYFITNTFFQLLITQTCKIKVIERFLDLPPLHSKGLSFQKMDDHTNIKRKKSVHINDLIQD
ncbi:mitochondrial inner membrane protein OXA1, putative [Plasmodium malariae]|uniref:Mitochondrial inner membrane protein OXA1, putative n=1 Tax=Plasmodium malariae TaxID=5858 RepID=A0A1C3KLG7_PLAMA|nr:mitochondrial inner membrane protein OXA1, putative [Plasmodium malariae]